MIEAVPASTEIQLRDRALIAFALLSGARDRAIISFKLKHIDIENELVEQDARDVRTKRAKTFTTWFFPVGKDLRHVFVEWVALLRERKGFGPEDPLFPKSKVGPGEDLEFRAVAGADFVAASCSNRLQPENRLGRKLSLYKCLGKSWLPFLNTYRTMCTAPSPDFLQALEGISALRVVA